MYVLGVEDVAAVAFAQVKTGEMCLRGLQREPGLLPSKVYVVDNLNMTMTYKFEFTPTPVQLAILTQSGVFPKPTGVSYTVQVP